MTGWALSVVEFDRGLGTSKHFQLTYGDYGCCSTGGEALACSVSRTPARTEASLVDDFKHHPVSCSPGQALAAWQLVSDGVQVQVEYLCCAVQMDLTTCATHSTPARTKTHGTHAQGGLLALGDHPVQCGLFEVLTAYPQPPAGARCDGMQSAQLKAGGGKSQRKILIDAVASEEMA